MINVLAEGLYIDIDIWNKDNKLLFIVSDYLKHVVIQWKTHGCSFETTSSIAMDIMRVTELNNLVSFTLMMGSGNIDYKIEENNENIQTKIRQK